MSAVTVSISSSQRLNISSYRKQQLEIEEKRLGHLLSRRERGGQSCWRRLGKGEENCPLHPSYGSHGSKGDGKPPEDTRMYNLRRLQAPPRDALARTCQGGFCSFFAIDAKTPLSLFPPTNFKESTLLRPYPFPSLPPLPPSRPRLLPGRWHRRPLLSR